MSGACMCGAVRPSGPLGEHRTSAPLVAADQRARQRTRREARSSQSGRRSRPGQTEGKSKRRRKEPLEAHGRPGTQLSLWMPPPGQAREAARRVFRAALSGCLSLALLRWLKRSGRGARFCGFWNEVNRTRTGIVRYEKRDENRDTHIGFSTIRLRTPGARSESQRPKDK